MFRSAPGFTALPLHEKLTHMAGPSEPEGEAWHTVVAGVESGLFMNDSRFLRSIQVCRDRRPCLLQAEQLPHPVAVVRDALLVLVKLPLHVPLDV